MATFTWQLQGTSPTTIGATDLIHFARNAFDTAIQVGSYQDSTHVRSSGGSNVSSGNTPKNVKYLTSTTADKGAGSVSLSSLTNADATLKINFSHTTAVLTSGAIFYAYDGTTTTAAPTGVTVKAAEIGNSSWSTPHGSAAALSIADDTSATSHDYYIAVSASPMSVGVKTAFAFRIELTYS